MLTNDGSYITAVIWCKTDLSLKTGRDYAFQPKISKEIYLKSTSEMSVINYGIYII